MNIGELYSDALSAASAAADLILVSPQEYTGFTPDDGTNTAETFGYVFQVVGDETVNLQSDITDHYVEDNKSLQDHIALKPKKVIVSGFQGELTNAIISGFDASNYDLATEAQLLAKEATDRLGTLSAYVPTISVTAQRAYDAASQIYALAQKIKRAANILMGVDVQTAQEIAYAKLESAWNNRVLFWVATPFGQFSNMAIESLVATQSEKSKSISDFTITFKQMRFAATKIVQSNRISGASTAVSKGSI